MLEYLSKLGRVTLSARVPRSSESCTYPGSLETMVNEGKMLSQGRGKQPATEMDAQDQREHSQLGARVPGELAEKGHLAEE